VVTLEVFSGEPPCPGSVAIIELAQRVAAKYQGELDLTILAGAEGMGNLKRTSCSACLRPRSMVPYALRACVPARPR